MNTTNGDFIEYDEYGDEIEYYAVRPNKTRIKKDIEALFKLAESLSKLAPAKLQGFELPDNLNKAIRDVADMPLTGARKRLLKYIAAQFHKMDVSPIQEKLARLQNQSVHNAREHHVTEQWRDKLINEGNKALTELFYEYPAADLQHIRQLLRNIKKETDSGQPPKTSRLLYRYLKTLLPPDGSEDTDFDGENNKAEQD